MSLYIGLISGTSADAIDAALVEVDAGARLRLYRPFPLAAELRAQLARCRPAQAHASLAALGRLDQRLGAAFADAALALLDAAAIAPHDVAAIGSHGQTLLHLVEGEAPFTWQVGDPNVIAMRTGITTVADFRRMDIAAGGQGAPLAPAFHAFYFRDRQRERAVLNLGGIANLTVLPADPHAPVTGFDTGPGNALLDDWANRHLDVAFDQTGAWGRGGCCDQELLEAMLSDPYFALAPPKSTGREYFDLAWLETHLSGNRARAPRDVQATLMQLTVRPVVAALEQCRPRPAELLVCGGGVHNAALMQLLQRAVPDCRVASTATLGLDPDAVEAVTFAWLASRRLQDLPGNLPSVTGARRAVPLGGIYRPAPG